MKAFIVALTVAALTLSGCGKTPPVRFKQQSHIAATKACDSNAGVRWIDFYPLNFYYENGIMYWSQEWKTKCLNNNIISGKTQGIEE